MKIVQDKVYPTMYRIQWPNGNLSLDMYNKTRASEYIRYPEVKDLKVGQIYNAI